MSDIISSSELNISQEFIDENNLCQHRPKTSPHTRSERIKRRDEVFKLHFEYGYSARQISKLMKINRNTVNSDVTFWYSKIKADYNTTTYVDWTNKQLSRLELQRVRLRKELDLNITLQERLQIEKILLELDSKISNLIIKLDTGRQETWDVGVGFLNDWMKKEGYKTRYMTFGSLCKIPEQTREKILELLNK